MTSAGARALPGWLRAVLAAPSRLYDAGLGRVLGTRFLGLTHTGRRSGREYHVVLEVVDRDRDSGAVVVVAGFGRGADWFRNVTAGGPAWVDLGRGPRAADHEVLAAGEAERVIAAYERRNRLAAPVLRRALSTLVGWRYGGTAADRRRLVEQLPVVRFTPASGPARSSGPPAS